MSKKILVGASFEVFLVVLASVLITTYVMRNNTPAEEIYAEPDPEDIEPTTPTLKDFYDDIEPVLEAMTLEEKVGQLLFARIPADNAVSELERYHLGGYILFGRDVEGRSLEQIKNANLNYKNSTTKIEPFLGIDEEGGSVSRLTYAGLANFKSPKELLGEECDTCALKRDTRDKIAILQDLGINVNFAPVADLCDNPNSFISARTLGSDPEKVSQYIGILSTMYADSSVSATLKHFPGYGCNADTHTGIAVDERPFDTYRSADLLPFTAGIEAGADFVMVSHNIVKSMDVDLPASLSSQVHNVLTEELGFGGVTITDDLSMNAISNYYHGEYPAVVQAVLAGNNMMIVSDYGAAFSQIMEALSNEVLTEEMIDERIIPILELKARKEMRLTR